MGVPAIMSSAAIPFLIATTLVLPPPVSTDVDTHREVATLDADQKQQSKSPPPVRFHETFANVKRAIVLDDSHEWGRWRVAFDGRNDGPGVTVRKGSLRLMPESVSTLEETRASMVVSKRTFRHRALTLRASWTSIKSTRVGTDALPWERGWLVWDYIDNDNFTYLILKPNGWEIGRRDPLGRGGQRFILTGGHPRTDWGQRRSVRVERDRGRTVITVDGRELARFRVPQGERHGRVGMYTEDAVVDWWVLRAHARS